MTSKEFIYFLIFALGIGEIILGIFDPIDYIAIILGFLFTAVAIYGLRREKVL
jgi:hypothetical protein